MKNIVVIFFLISISFSCYSINLDTITENIIVVNEGYDRVSAIKTNKGIVVIDTHKSTIDMQRMKRKIISYFNDSTFAYIINTHSCLEHINGNPVFADVPKIAHINFKAAVQPVENDNRIAFLKRRIPELELKLSENTDTNEINRIKQKLHYLKTIKTDFIKAAVAPDIVFSEKMQLNMGNVTIELFYIGRGAHGDDGILIYIPEENTLFTGSTLSKPPKIYKTGDWNSAIDIKKWISVLDTFLAKSNLKHIVASHISYYSPNDMQQMRDYYQLLYTTVKNYKEAEKILHQALDELNYTKIKKQFCIFDKNEKWRKRHDENVENLWNYL